MTRVYWPVPLVMALSRCSTSPLSLPPSPRRCGATADQSMVSSALSGLSHLSLSLSLSLPLPLSLSLSLSDFDWSVANELLVSVSSDGTARLWDPTLGVCVREITESGSGRCLCCRFHPNNNNLVAVSSFSHTSTSPVQCSTTVFLIQPLR